MKKYGKHIRRTGKRSGRIKKILRKANAKRFAKRVKKIMATTTEKKQALWTYDYPNYGAGFNNTYDKVIHYVFN